MSKKILVEEYRPNRLSDIVGLGYIGFPIDQNIPHLLLTGSPGTGKTSLAKVIIKTLGAEALILNASKDRGVDVVRSQVNTFAASRSLDGGIRIVFLDEADYLTPDAQASLRNVMETYSSNCKFILTCNFESRIIEPIKSRCTVIQFGYIVPEDIVGRLEFICKNEEIPYEVDALRKIVKQTGSDIRAAINRIERMKDGVLLSRIGDEMILAKEMWSFITLGMFTTARQLYLNKKPNDEILLSDLYDIMIADTSITMDKTAKMIHAFAHCYRYFRDAAWKQILVEDLMLTLVEIGGWGLT